jgi:hypothetical protein
MKRSWRSGIQGLRPPHTLPEVIQPVEPPLHCIHSDRTLEAGTNRITLEYWRKQPTADIVKSLQPGGIEALKTKSDGRIMNGNTRLKVLEERGFDINSLPREVLL